jgi:1,4-dihydroxy-6-naphthoate synthase
VLVRIAHSPDADDAFMFYALARGKIPANGFEFEHILKDIESLNQEALKGTYEVTAVSFHAYPYISERYALLTSGSSVGDGYGPIVVAKRKMKSLSGKKIAVPGRLTTAYLALKLYLLDFQPVFINFDEIISAVKRGDVDAGLIIHEGQLTYAQENLEKIVDLGEWWLEKTGLPLPLGGNAVRKDLGEKIKKIALLIKESIKYSLSHRKEALDYALSFSRGLEESEADKFVGMYVNEWTLDLGERGRKAVEVLLKKGVEKGIIEGFTSLEWIEV